MSTPVIEAKALTKRYRGALAVDRLDLSVERGEVFGLLGPNGAGKTTTILMILGLTEPTSGSITTVGYDPLRQPLEVKRRVGYLPDSVGFYDHMTGRDNLRFIARLGGLRPDQIESSIATALERVRLDEVADRRVATYSRGMRQRLGIESDLAVTGRGIAPGDGSVPRHQLVGRIVEDVVAPTHDALSPQCQVFAAVGGAIRIGAVK